MARLKNDTLEHHKRAESKPLERALIKGAISRELYCDYLTQRYFLHVSLDATVLHLCAVDSRLSDLVSDDLLQTPRLLEDLRFLGCDPATGVPRPATVRLLADFSTASAACPISPLGAYYVFEGSKNGARYICRPLRPALGLTGARGWSYLDPHGDQQPVLWADFKRRMDEIDFNDFERDTMVALAAVTFDRIAELDDEIWSAMGGSAR